MPNVQFAVVNSLRNYSSNQLKPCLLTIVRQLTARKKMLDVQIEIDTQNELIRNLNWIQLLGIGIGATIGAGIFVLSGEAAAKYSGPSVIVSFLLTGCVALLSSLSYSELGAMMSHSGSVFTYTYTALGEYAAWLIGWNSVLLYLFGVLTVTINWSKCIVLLINLVSSNYNVTSAIVEAPIAWDQQAEGFFVTDQVMNMPAIAINMAISIVLITGIRQTAIISCILVVIKVIIILLFIFACCGYVNRNNYQPFVPANKGSFNEYGISGLLKASTHVFFAYVGFDTISTVAQETKSPEKAVPLATIGTTMITLLLYIGISTVMVGLVPYPLLNSKNPLGDAIQATPFGLWLRIVMTIGAIVSLTTVSMLIMLAQTRIFYAMAHDGLLPPIFARVHSKTRTPWVSTVIAGIFCSIFSGICPVDILGESTSIGALISYLFVHITVIVMRYTHHDMPRRFKVPFGNWLIPTIGSVLCVLLMAGISKPTAYRFLIWTALGHIFYFTYGFRHSRQRKLMNDHITNNNIEFQIITRIKIPEEPMNDHAVSPNNCQLENDVYYAH